MQKPTFTVIITTHNRKSLLSRAIQSVLGQTFPHFELLVIDNGSTDGTGSVVSQIKDSRLKYVQNPNPTDSCDAPRNLGIQMARGRFTAFLDDDDIWYPQRLKKVKKAFDAHSDASCVCHYKNLKVDGKTVRLVKQSPWSENFYEYLLYNRNCITPSATTVKTDLLKKLNGINLKEEFSGAADYDLWLRLAKKKAKFHIIDTPLGDFNVNRDNYSLKEASYTTKVIAIAKTHMLAYENKPFLRHISKKGARRLFQLYAIATREYLKSRDYKKALRHGLCALFFLLRHPSFTLNVFSKLKKGASLSWQVSNQP